MKDKDRKTLEEAGLLYRQVEPLQMPIILKYNMYLTREDRDIIRKEIKETSGREVIIIPNSFDLVTALGRWIARTDKEYAGGGYFECSVCGQRYSWGAYFEPDAFRHCPRCGHQMEVEEE